MRRKALIIGLDCLTPQLTFDRFLGKMPNLQSLLGRSIYGELESCHPPITIPAWMVMATGQSPPALGLYGFRHRKNSSYTDIWIANSHSVKEPTIWDIVGQNDGQVCLVGVPPSYPPKHVNGCLVSCFITPDTTKGYTYPPQLKEEIEELVGEYIVDVEFRTEEKDQLLQQIYEMTDQRFEVVKHLMKTKPWQLFMFVEMGPDRIHHGFWKFCDPQHHLYQPGNQFASVLEQYYAHLDAKLGELLSLLDDDTVVFIVSDHGAKSMKGAFCINEWLIQQGYLKLKQNPTKVARLEDCAVDWENTLAWGWGGYYARIFLNLAGREPLGKISAGDYSQVRDELSDRIMQITGPEGEPMDNRVFKPEENWQGNPPDLMVYFDDLNYRSAGTLGHHSLFLRENDTGPDDAVHAQHGIFVMYDPKAQKSGRRKGLHLLDFAPTVLQAMGLPILDQMEGRVLE